MEPFVQYIQEALHLGVLATQFVIAILAIVVAGVVFSVGMTIAGLMVYAERRVSGRIQSRIGPNRVGPFGLLQWLVDGLKLIMKEDIIPDPVDKPLFKLAPSLVVMGVFGSFAVLPFGVHLVGVDLNVGIFFILAVTSVVTVGILMSGWASNNKWSLIGGIRASAQIVSYEIPNALAILSVVLLAGTMSMQGIIAQQGGWPWEWMVSRNVFAFVAFFLYFTSALAEGNRTPFDLPEAESELVSGFNTEYSGMRFAGFFLAEFANVYLMSAITATLFFGGWQIPGISADAQAASIPLQIIGLIIFITKAGFFCFVVLWLRWTLPRLRIDQLMNLCYKFLVPIGFFCLLGNALYMLLIPRHSMLDKVSYFSTALIGLFIIAVFFNRVFFHLKRAGVKIDLNFLARGEKGTYDPKRQVRAYGAFRRKYGKETT